MKVDQHISELLYDHDCVVVPAFGGFLASYRHAVIHSSQHTFSPPSKKIAFNVFLKHNDGLLVSHIAGMEKVSYADALTTVERYVNTWQKELSEGKKLVMEQVGIFYLDAENNVQFEPVKNVNYLRDAFGLGTVQYLPVKRETHQQKAEKQVRELMAPRPSEPPGKQPLKLSRRNRRKLLSTLIISATLLWFSFTVYLVTPHRLDLSSLNPFSSDQKTLVQKQEIKPVSHESIQVSPEKVETVYVANATPAITAGRDTTLKPEAQTAPNPVGKEMEALAAIQNYFVIGGAFQVAENADAFVKKLQADGFPEARILDAPTRLKMVCFKGFFSHAEAVRESDSLKALSRGAWIYKW